MPETFGEARPAARRLASARRAPSRDGTEPRRAGAWQAIYRTLKDGIVSMRLTPGTPLFEKRIAADHGLSRTPAREAILRLADEGLVEIFPQSGTFVARIPLDALPEAMLIRKALEGVTARLAAERTTPDRIRTLAAIVERQRAAASADDRDAFHSADEAFHAGIAEAAGHPGIWSLAQQTKVQVDRCRRLTLPIPGRMATVIGDHELILSGVERGDGQGAVRAMERHLDAVLTTLSITRDEHKDFFTGNRDVRVLELQNHPSPG